MERLLKLGREYELERLGYMGSCEDFDSLVAKQTPFPPHEDELDNLPSALRVMSWLSIIQS